MRIVDVYSKEDCHLCDMAVADLSEIRKDHPFTLNVIKIREGDEWYDEFHERVPVIYIDKRFAFQYKVRRDEFVERLGGNARSEERRRDEG